MATLRAVRALATLMTIEAAPIVYFRPKEMEPAPEGSPQLDEMLCACDVSTPLDKWNAKLSEEQLAKLRDVVLGES